MDSFEFELWIAQYKQQIKDARAERPLSDAEIDRLTENLHYMPEEYSEAFRLAQDENFGQFEKLPHLLRNYLGALEMREFRRKFGDPPLLEDAAVREYLAKKAMNAAFRAGVSAEKSVPGIGTQAKAYDTYMNGVLMKRTMMPPSESGRQEIQAHYGADHVNEELERNMAKQLVMAKVMLLAQLGKYEIINKNSSNRELDVPVYETLVHGNRSNFILPAGDGSQGVLDAFMGADSGRAAEIEKRTAATHSVKRRAFKKSGILSSESKEERTYSPLKVFGNQYGMNIAVGGIGEIGPDKKVILGKGEAGHMYMRAEGGDAKHCGSLLIGIEGSAPGADNYLGNEHGILAKSAKQSAFLADKSVVGQKVGGRQVDLSGISAEALTNILNRFSEKYGALQRDPTGREKLIALNDMLMGKHMDVDRLMEMFNSLGMSDIKDVVTQARKGYLNNARPEMISGNEFTQSIRKGIAQTKACDLAEARFEYAGNDLKRSVGAIKELVLTHATRKLGWKIMHPIKNYRENATISSLVERLESAKHVDRAAIASAFAQPDDTFSMDWGVGLSNDRAAVAFYVENKSSFKASDYKLISLLKSTYKVGKSRDTARKDEALETKATEEIAEMNEDLREVKNGESLESGFGKESIVVREEDEKSKSAEKLSSTLHEQPTVSRKKGL